MLKKLHLFIIFSLRSKIENKGFLGEVKEKKLNESLNYKWKVNEEIMKVFLYKWKYWRKEVSFLGLKWKWNESEIKENKAWALYIWFYPLRKKRFLIISELQKGLFVLKLLLPENETFWLASFVFLFILSKKVKFFIVTKIA